jgi:hypothetical protein
MGLRFSSAALSKGRTQQYPDFDGYAVTPSDSADLPNGPCKGLIVTGTLGTVAVQMDSDTTATLTVGGTDIYLIGCSRVMATGTSAGGIYALY